MTKLLPHLSSLLEDVLKRFFVDNYLVSPFSQDACLHWHPFDMNKMAPSAATGRNITRDMTRRRRVLPGW